MLTADHGCDPATAGAGHTREHVPLLAWFDGHAAPATTAPMADVGAPALRWLTGGDAPPLPGESFV